MNKKLWFLTKMSLNKKIKTKWFIIANIFLCILIIGLANIDSIIKLFGGDFDKENEILVIDRANVYDKFNDNYQKTSKYLSEFDDTIITKYNDTYEKGVDLVKDNDNKILLVINYDKDNYIKATIVSNKSLGTVYKTLVNTTLKYVRSELALSNYDLTREEFNDIEAAVEIDNVVLSEKSNIEDDFIISAIMDVIIVPIFLLIMFLIQMIGAEVNEEKSTRSMEIIISNVSPKTHFLSKIIAANAFVLIQGGMLILYAIIAVVIRFIISGGNLTNNIDSEILSVIDTIQIDKIINTINIMLPILIIMLILTFLAYSLLAGILASMTTNLEDFQQLQSPIMVVSLVGFYLSVMISMFKGSTFIHIMSYIPFISSMLAPTLYVLGEISIIDVIISILLLVLVIHILIKYGLRIYKVGILNYSGNDLWKKMFSAIKEKR